MRRNVCCALLLAATFAFVGSADVSALAQGFAKNGPMPGAKGPRPMAPGAIGPRPKGAPGGVPRYAVKDQGSLRPGGLRWVDMHMHLVPSRGNFSDAITEALSLMNRAGVTTAVVMPTPQSSSVFTEREYLPLLKRHADRFVWFGGGAT